MTDLGTLLKELEKLCSRLGGHLVPTTHGFTCYADRPLGFEIEIRPGEVEVVVGRDGEILFREAFSIDGGERMSVILGWGTRPELRLTAERGTAETKLKVGGDAFGAVFLRSPSKSRELELWIG